MTNPYTKFHQNSELSTDKQRDNQTDTWTNPVT